MRLFSVAFPDVVLDRRVTAPDAMFIPQPLKNAPGGGPLRAVPDEILQQPLVDEAGRKHPVRAA